MNVLSSLRALLTLAELEMRRLKHDPTEVFIRAVQPALWLGVFGTVMSKLRAFPINSTDYLTFIAPGVVMQSVTFISLAYGMMLVWERESGILKKLLTAPIYRWTIVLGRSLAGAIRASTQLIIVLLIALLLGAKLVISVKSLIIAFGVLMLGSLGFSAISIFIASIFKTRERFMGIIGALTMPLFFASNAIYPIEVMPTPLRIVSSANPLTYIVSCLRDSLVYADYVGAMMEFIKVLVFAILAIIIASMNFKKIIE